MEHAQKLRAANDPSWWKLHESCLVAVSNVKEILIELNTAGSLEFDLSGFVNQIVIGCLHESSNLAVRGLLHSGRDSTVLSFSRFDSSSLSLSGGTSPLHCQLLPQVHQPRDPGDVRSESIQVRPIKSTSSKSVVSLDC